MKDQNGFSSSDMTPEGWADYQHQLGEIAAQRGDKQSRYNGVSRVHCRNGYVDVLSARYGNGSSIDMTVDDFRSKVRSEGIRIDDYNYRS